MKNYRECSYFKDSDGLWKVVVDDAYFIVALDDSKSCFNKRIILSKNNESTCKEYIDWLNK